MENKPKKEGKEGPNKEEVLKKLKDLKHPFGGAGGPNGMMDKLFPKDVLERAKKQKEAKEAMEKRKAEMAGRRSEDSGIPGQAEPEYESPSADEGSVRSNKRTETIAPDPTKEEL
eukprot:50565_1